MARPRAEMRKKMLWPTVYSNRALCEIEKTRPWIFKSWAGTLSATDDWGRFAWDPWRMAGLIWSRNQERQDGYEDDLNALRDAGLVVQYGANGEYGCFPKFEEHNSMYRPTPSEYPDPAGRVSPPEPPLNSKEEREGEGEGNLKLTAASSPINLNKTPAAPQLDKDGFCGHGYKPSHCPKCKNGEPADAPPAQKRTTGKLGFDPLNYSEEVELEDGSIAPPEEVHRAVYYHWKVNPNPFWRERSPRFFKENLPKMIAEMPADFTIPTKTLRHTKSDCSFCHGEGKKSVAIDLNGAPWTEQSQGRRYWQTVDCDCLTTEVAEA